MINETSMIKPKAETRTPDGIVKGKDIDFYFWLGEGSEEFIKATPQEIEAVDAMFPADVGNVDQYSFDWTGLGR